MHHPLSKNSPKAKPGPFYNVMAGKISVACRNGGKINWAHSVQSVFSSYQRKGD